MAQPSIIDDLYKGHLGVLEVLERHKEISLKNASDDTFKKFLAVAAASYFEQRVQNVILSFATSQSTSAVIVSFLKAKAVDRQFHTYFNWEAKNANHFFGLFGPDFIDSAKHEIANNMVLDQAIKAFLEMGNIRNVLAHSDVASYFLEKTAAEIYELYLTALPFIDFLDAQFGRFCGQQKPPLGK